MFDASTTETHLTGLDKKYADEDKPVFFGAFSCEIENRNKPEPLRFELVANEEHPVINPAFVITGWGDADATLKINGRAINRGKKFRFGHRHSPDGKDLIVWIKIESSNLSKFHYFPVVDNVVWENMYLNRVNKKCWFSL
ncbi:MAG: hypothetical protein KAY65_14560 [Planctomycetes bacterium]|nr:hypothetical protein [Planctomycetota bacterium]